MSILCATLGSGGPGWCFSVMSESCRCCDCSSIENDSSKEGLLRLFLPFPSSASVGIPLSSSSPLLPVLARSLSSFLLSSLSSRYLSAASSCLYFCLSSELVGLSDPFSDCLPQGASVLWGLQSILWESFLPYFLLMFPKSCSLTSCRPLPLERCTKRKSDDNQSRRRGKDCSSISTTLYNQDQNTHSYGHHQTIDNLKIAGFLFLLT